MIFKIFRFGLGLLGVALNIGYAWAFTDHILGIREIRTPEMVFLLGVTSYLAFHVLITAPTRAYVFGHELMHATATWLSGGQVKGFKAGAKKGAVTTNRVSGLIALAPYLVPVYSIVWAMLYGVVGFFIDVRPWIRLFFFGLGVTLTFHLVFTVNALKQKQSDLEVAGPILSLMLILFANMALVIGAMGLFVPEVRFLEYLASGLRNTQYIIHVIEAQLFIR